MNLTETKLKRAPVVARRLYDRDGLYIQCNSSKSAYRYWRLKYYRPTNKKEATLAIGTYPEISLAEARESVRLAKKQIAQGVDPKDVLIANRTRSEEQSKRTFEKVTQDCLKRQTLAPSTQVKKNSRISRYVLPHIGKKSVKSITTADLAEIVNKLIDAGKLETARKIRRDIDKVFVYAAQNGFIEHNPAQNLRGLVPASKVKHQPAIIEPIAFGKLLRDIDTYNHNSVVGLALKLAPLVFQRPGELVSMEWSELDLAKSIWVIPAEKKKERQHLTADHIVPLSRQAIEIIKSAKTITEHNTFVFSNQQHNEKHISTASVIKALRSLGYDTKKVQSIHGFRASARTLLEEQLKVRREYIEQQLSHTVKDSFGRAYNRTLFVKERSDMMQSWADYLDQLKSLN
ncbi:Integrase [Pseudidiomarina planktonica]|uniref:Integrase n=1 Tax=Pseudidiomarina planktonica TaxID=1323738 RepID=A0A1Y6FYL0_9GAMM|nr:integrase arm-type DNA-binding domain-containing protein [Pseudidiomarina planktonica]RUO63247.1 integrase [Pseudidiomarina planktonica]SMQ80538.1 Integrase [Pseudidiomarina planktonica]